MSLNVNEWRILKEKIEVLAGERGDPQKAAIRMAYIKSLQELIGNLRGSTLGLQQNIDALNVEFNNTQALVGFLQADVDSAQADITSLQSNISTIQTDLSNATASLTQLNNDIAAIQTEINGLAGLEARLDTLQSDVSAVAIPAATATAVSAAPTAAQYNVLLDDVNALRTALTDLKNAIL